MELETAGYFGLVSLSTDPRWRSHSIYLFGVDMYGNTLFTISALIYLTLWHQVYKRLPICHYRWP